ncbi:MFS transporter [Marivibrio halodurans]|uniref:MFS transporter n=1 Tax=Marivibrio halodurans TaxID=2039722 RepID=A0A8J7V0A1_9PROT|nr:MFS transporter [Marivibrio halodurans]MBP5856576.1 MFS transporter [Marivibrio halodurans]
MTDGAHTVPPAARRARMRGYASVIASNICFGLAIGMFLPLIPLRLDQAGTSALLIGVNAAASSCAIFVTGPYIGQVLRRAGYAGALFGGALLFAAATLAMIVWPGYAAWTALRFVAGLGMSVHWVASESWLNAAADERERGRVLSIYVAAFIGGTAGGPLVLNLIGTGGSTAFVAIILLSVLSALAILPGRSGAPVFEPMAKAAFAKVFRIAPRLMSAGLLMGVAQGAALTLMALYGVRAGLPESDATLLQAALLGGGLLLQFPIGWLADRVGDRHRLIVLLALVSVAGAGLLVPLTHDPVLLYPMVIVWGGCLIGIYTVALALLGARFAQLGGMAAANAAFILTWELGTFSGGPIAGGVMQVMGPPGMALVMGVSAAAVGLLMAWRVALDRPG